MEKKVKMVSFFEAGRREAYIHVETAAVSAKETKLERVTTHKECQNIRETFFKHHGHNISTSKAWTY